jgi:TonB-dependent starch-binding outer membrane protein SusC
MRKKRLIILCLTGLFLILNMGISFAQRTLVKGTIVDATNNTALPGVNVVESGTSNGTVTDLNGDFTIEVAGPGSMLEFSYVGYLSETVDVGDKTQITVTLVEDIQKLDEVVVIGYGTQKKSDLTGSVSVVNTENLDKIASSDISKVLQGQTSGVQVFGGGEPGAIQRVQIRGIGTFGNTEPLYVIDGVPVSGTTNLNISGQSIQFENNAPGYGSSAPSGGISDFNPADIESVQVLKDASAAAIYGARGANGVVIITTKRGKAGAIKVTYDGNFGFQHIQKRLDLTGTAQFQEINNTARLNDNTFMARVNNPKRPEYISPDSIDTDWQKETFCWGHVTDHNLSFQGGTESSTYFANINYFDQTGTVVGNGPRYTKYGAQLNLDQKKGRLKFGESFSYAYSKQIRLTSSRWNNYVIELIQAIPTVQVYDTANKGGYGGSNNDYLQIAGNPVAFNNLKEVTFNRHRFLGIVYGELEILKSLSYRINLSYDRSEWYNSEFIPVYNVGNRHTWEIATLNEWRGESPLMVMENLLNFKKVVGKHDIAAVIGYTAQKDWAQDIYAHAEGFTEPYKKVISGVPSGQTALGEKEEHTMLSYLGRVNYSYADRYLLSATYRRDYSSNFGPNNKYGNFPAVALAWKVSNEPFFDVPLINMLKIRGGWGKIGNEKIGAYLYETTVNNAVTYVFGGGLNGGTTQTYYTDPSIRWEERVTTNVGFDLAMLKNKIELSAEYYYNTANDILMNYPIPISSGAVGWSIPAANGASMINQGIEISASYRKYEGDFHYQIGGNLTTLKNEVTRIGGANLPVETGTSRTEVGRTMGELYGYVFDGIFQSTDQINTVAPFDETGNPNPGYDATKHAFQHVQTKPGDVMFKDLNGDGQITEDGDRDFLGVAIPKFTYGLNLSADYKGFDLSVFIQGIYGNKVFNQVYRVNSSLGEGNYSVESFENYWMPVDSAVGRQSNKWPRPSVIDNNQNSRVSDRWVQNGSYLRVQNVQLGYDMPKSWFKKVRGIDNLRIYVQAQNLLTFTKLYGYDPDFINDGTFNRGYSGGSFPSPTTYMIGIKLGL